MAVTKVLVVDDSLTMRALISGALERVPQVEVVGSASGAAEARELTAQLNPDVITLDVEMPGMSGLEYLAEVMDKRPMRVIMFSTRTEAGAEDSVEALRLGAVDCFPKPRVATPAELNKIIAKLGKCIKTARHVAPKSTAVVAPVDQAQFDWNGRLLAVGADTSNTKALFDLFGSFPVNCPPTLVVQHLSAALAEGMVGKLDEKVGPRVVLAQDGMAVEQGTIYFASPGDAHMVVDGWPSGTIRLLPRDAVVGERPSISVLLASVAKAAEGESLGLLLASGSQDGSAGMKALMAAGGYGITPGSGTSSDFVLAHGLVTQPLPAADLPRSLLKLFCK